MSEVRLFPEEQRSRREHDDATPCGPRKRSGLLNAQQPETRRASALRDPIHGPAMAVARHVLEAHAVDDVYATQALMNESA